MMQSRRTTNALLAAIALFLGCLALRTTLDPASPAAAGEAATEAIARTAPPADGADEAPWERCATALEDIAHQLELMNRILQSKR